MAVTAVIDRRARANAEPRTHHGDLAGAEVRKWSLYTEASVPNYSIGLPVPIILPLTCPSRSIYFLRWMGSIYAFSKHVSGGEYMTARRKTGSLLLAASAEHLGKIRQRGLGTLSS
jgi:hypothetical protein